jgi:hypothetical protein
MSLILAWLLEDDLVFVPYRFEALHERVVRLDRRVDGLLRGLREPHANQKPLAYVRRSKRIPPYPWRPPTGDPWLPWANRAILFGGAKSLRFVCLSLLNCQVYDAWKTPDDSS